MSVAQLQTIGAAMSLGRSLSRCHRQLTTPTASACITFEALRHGHFVAVVAMLGQMPCRVRLRASLHRAWIDGSESDAGWNSEGHCTGGNLSAGGDDSARSHEGG